MSRQWLRCLGTLTDNLKVISSPWDRCKYIYVCTIAIPYNLRSRQLANLGGRKRVKDTYTVVINAPIITAPKVLSKVVGSPAMARSRMPKNMAWAEL